MTRDELIARAKASGLDEVAATAKADAFLRSKGREAEVGGGKDVAERKPTPPKPAAKSLPAAKTPEPPKPGAAVSAQVPRTDKPVGAPARSAEPRAQVQMARPSAVSEVASVLAKPVDAYRDYVASQNQERINRANQFRPAPTPPPTTIPYGNTADGRERDDRRMTAMDYMDDGPPPAPKPKAPVMVMDDYVEPGPMTTAEKRAALTKARPDMAEKVKALSDESVNAAYERTIGG